MLISHKSKETVRVLLLSLNRELAPQPVYPLGLEYLQAACRTAGFETCFCDCNLFSDPEADLISAISSFNPDFVLASLRNVDSIESVNTKYYLPEARQTIQLIKKSCQATVVIGGSGFSLFPVEILDAVGADYGVVGPGEGIIVDLISRLNSQQAVNSLPGLVYRSDIAEGQILINPPDLFNCVSLPLSRSNKLVDFYWKRGGFMNVQIKRGCPFHCIYCTYPILEGRKVQSRSLGCVIDEIEDLYKKEGVDKFFIVDNVFNLKSELVNEFAQEIIRRSLKIGWTGYFTPAGVGSEQIELWKRSGLIGIEFGVDTLANELLKRYRKDFSLEDVKRAAKACAEHDLPYSLFLIFGGPGETIETVEESIAYCLKLPKVVVLVLLGMRIYPQTELQQIAINENVLGKDESLLKPRFYFSPSLDIEMLHQRLSELSPLSNWCILGHGWEEKQELAKMMRAKGYKGSLWELCSP